MTEQLPDDDTREAIVSRCIREVEEGDLAGAYQLVEEYIEGLACDQGLADRRPLLRRLLRDRVHDKFVAAAMARIGDAHPFKGKRKHFNFVRWRNEVLNRIGIDGDGQLWNPNNYPEDKVRAALRHVAAKREVRRKEGAIKAVKTRARRHSELIYKIAAGILTDHKYGPHYFCCICKKNLSDQKSHRERGIGPECWNHNSLTLIEHTKDREAADAATRVA